MKRLPLYQSPSFNYVIPRAICQRKGFLQELNVSQLSENIHANVCLILKLNILLIIMYLKCLTYIMMPREGSEAV